MKIKHNKIRNTAILFELLVRQITTDTLGNKDSKALDILKKYYNNTEVAKEYKIYNTLSSAKHLSEQKADILINAAVDAFRKLNKVSLKKQKYDLISEIKSVYNIDEFFKSKVENYKTLASIYLLFEMDNPEYVNPGKYTDCKMTILEAISRKPETEIKDELLEQFSGYDKGTKSLVYKLLVKKFNEKYNDLDGNQKALLKEYINNISTTEKLKDYVNREFIAVKKQICEQIRNITDEVRKVKLEEVVSFVKEIPANKNVTDKDVHNLLYYYELIKEFTSINEKEA